MNLIKNAICNNTKPNNLFFRKTKSQKRRKHINMNKKTFFIISLITLAIWTSSCYKDKFDLDKLSTKITWNPNLAVPAVHSILNYSRPFG